MCYNTTNCVKTMVSVICKNDDLRRCNKLPGNNVDFATGCSDVKIGSTRTHGNGLYAIIHGTCSFIDCQSTSTDSEGTFSVFESSCHLYHSKVEAIPLSALPKSTTSELAGLSSLYPFNAERQARKQ